MKHPGAVAAWGARAANTFKLSGFTDVMNSFESASMLHFHRPSSGDYDTVVSGSGGPVFHLNTVVSSFVGCAWLVYFSFF